MTILELSNNNVGRLVRATHRIDKAWLAVFGIIVALAVLDNEQVWPSVRFAVEAMIDVLPFLVVAITIAAYAKASGTDNLIAKAFQGRAAMMVVTASLVGALSPFCSCGVIPLIAALLAMGVPLPGVMAFWLASPLMDPSMFLLTSATMGTGFAVAKTIAAIGVGMLGGFGTLAIARAGVFADPLREGMGGGCGGGAVRAPVPVKWRFWDEPARRTSFLDGAKGNIFFLGKWLTLAFLLESVMLAYVPAEDIANLVGGSGIGPILLSTIVGVPAYLNGFAALPLVSGLTESGMSPGAAMAFLMAGGVSSLPAAIAVYALVRKHVFAAYLGFALIGSMLSGLAYAAVMA
jgi:uncharacterized membrane protein YraQ (UPF0718 family)